MTSSDQVQAAEQLYKVISYYQNVQICSQLLIPFPDLNPFQISGYSLQITIKWNILQQEELFNSSLIIIYVNAPILELVPNFRGEKHNLILHAIISTTKIEEEFTGVWYTYPSHQC